MTTDIFNLINSNSSINDIITLIKNNESILNTTNIDGQTPIMLSLSKGMEELAIQILNFDNKFDIVDKFGNTSFIYACKKSLTTIISKLLKRLNDINVNQVNNDGDSALIICCRNKLESSSIEILDVAKETIKLDIISKSDNNTAFMIALKNNMVQTANKLLTFNIDKLLVNNVNSDGLTAKQIALNNGLKDIVETLDALNTDVFTLIDNNDLDGFKKITTINQSLLNKLNSMGQTPIIYSILNSKTEFSFYLLQNNIILNTIDYYGFTPLMYACMLKDSIYDKILDIAKEKGGSYVAIQYINSNSDSAFSWACENSLTDIALRIIDFKFENINLDTLILACKKGMNRVVLKIIDMDTIDLSQVDKFGNTILQLCCIYKLNDVAIKLLEKDSNSIKLNNVSNKGYTAFMLACEYRLNDVANAILKYNSNEINISHINNDGNTSIMLACKNKMDDIAIKILDTDADIIRLNHINNDGYTALMFAAMYKLENIALAMLDNGSDAVRLDQVNKYNQSAYTIAINNNLTKLIETIKIYSTNIFSIIDNNESVDSFINYVKNKPDTLQLLNKDGNTILVESIKKNRPDITIKILEFETDIKNKKLNTIDEFGFTPLMLACLYSTEDVVLKFLEFKPKDILLDYINTNGDTAFIICCAKSLSNASIKMLSFNPVDIRLGQINDKGNNGLIIACRYKLEQTALEILENRNYAKVDTINKANDNALIWACRNSLTKVINKLLDMGDAKLIGLDVVGFNNETPFILACENKLEEEALRMLEYGIESINFDFKKKDELDGRTISKNNNLEKVNLKIKELTRNNIFYLMRQNRSSNDISLLIKNNQSVLSQLNHNKQTPLMYSIILKKQFIPSIILQNGYELNKLDSVDKYNRTALLYACKYANENVAIQIINVDKEFNTIGMADTDGFTPLIWACKNKMIKTINKILSIPIEKINLAQSAFSNTALVEACISGMTDIVDSILKFKPDEYNISILFKEFNRIIDNNGNTLLDIISKFNYTNLMNIMKPFLPKKNENNLEKYEINDDTMIIEPTLKYTDMLEYDDVMVNAKEYLEAVSGSIIVQSNNFLYGTTIHNFNKNKFIMFPCNTIVQKGMVNNYFKNLELFDITKSSGIPIDGMVNYKTIKQLINKTDDNNRLFKLINTNKKYISPISYESINNKDTQYPTCNIEGGYIYNLVSIKQYKMDIDNSVEDIGVTENEIKSLTPVEVNNAEEKANETVVSNASEMAVQSAVSMGEEIEKSENTTDSTVKNSEDMTEETQKKEDINETNTQEEQSSSESQEEPSTETSQTEDNTNNESPLNSDNTNEETSENNNSTEQADNEAIKDEENENMSNTTESTHVNSDSTNEETSENSNNNETLEEAALSEETKNESLNNSVPSENNISTESLNTEINKENKTNAINNLENIIKSQSNNIGGFLNKFYRKRK